MRNFAQTGFGLLVVISIAACGGGSTGLALGPRDTAVAPDRGTTAGDVVVDVSALGKDAAVGSDVVSQNLIGEDASVDVPSGNRDVASGAGDNRTDGTAATRDVSGGSEAGDVFVENRDVASAAGDVEADSPTGNRDVAGAVGDIGTSLADGGATRDGPPSGAMDAQSLDGLLSSDSAAADCPDALPLKCGDRLNHSTLVQGRADLWHAYSCSQRWESGRETAYALRTATACQVVARLKNTTADLQLFIMPKCDPISCTSVTSGAFATEAGQAHFIVVDGYDGAAGDYSLEVDCTCQ